MIQQIGRFDGENYFLIKDGKEIPVSKLEYDLECSVANDTLRELLREIFRKFDEIEKKLTK